ncbi:unnamed protein product [Notodromas monacha]|uniref:beta-N-acetylhexosaminidase n=1 Tax=Notodromas monacha TaxID=399045 RepID=A0A7R9BQG9_9CRUS|nr:unnamed protein product [Notodromas monacha]CAG0919801.1 unnamed protein product [Notodromas monacha]
MSEDGFAEFDEDDDPDAYYRYSFYQTKPVQDPQQLEEAEKWEETVIRVTAPFSLIAKWCQNRFPATRRTWRRRLAAVTVLLFLVLVFTVASVLHSPRLRRFNFDSQRAREAGMRGTNKRQLQAKSSSILDEARSRHRHAAVDAGKLPNVNVHLKHPINVRSINEMTGFGHQGQLDSHKTLKHGGVVLPGPEIQPGEHVLVHLDFKGAPPKISYLKKLFPLIKELGATGIMIEYEDTFPFWGELKRYSSSTEKYSIHQVSQIVASAKQLNLIIIPLVDTIGNLDWILKHSDFGPYREIPTNPQTLCPSKEAGFELIKAIIDQILTLHNESNWIHLGGAGAQSIGECRVCKERTARRKWSREDLYLDHMSKIAQYVKVKYDMQAIIWDDELRSISHEKLSKSPLTDLIEPMILNYKESKPGDNSTLDLTSYQGSFKYIWGAGAFKGADSVDSLFPSYEGRLKNILEWVQFIRKTEGTTSLSFRGFVLIGRQSYISTHIFCRFSHFSTLCELLPVSLPVLGMILQVVKGSPPTSSAVIQYLTDVFSCPSLFEELAKATEDNNRANFHKNCKFDGSQIFSLALSIHSARANLDTLENSQSVKGYWTKYNLDNGFVSPMTMSQLDVIKTFLEINDTMTRILHSSEAVFGEVYGPDTVYELLDTFVIPLTSRARKWAAIARNVSTFGVSSGGFRGWKSRPVHHNGPSLGHLAEDL